MDEETTTLLQNSKPSSVKFTLYLKAHELQEISKVLERVAHMPERKRRAWAQEHGDFINHALDSIVQESNATLSELSFDDETLQLSKDLIVSLRDTVDMFHGLLYQNKKISS
jgi:hypothetical protein